MRRTFDSEGGFARESFVDEVVALTTTDNQPMLQLLEVRAAKT